MKKVGELSTLCGIDACAIIYSQYEPRPEVWPNTEGVQRVLSQFKRMPEMEQSKKMVNQESVEIYKRIDQISATKKKNTTTGKVGCCSGSGCGSGSAAAMLKGKGVANCVDGTEEKAIEGEMEAMQQQQQRPPWFSDWINSNSGNSSTDQMLNQQQHCQNLGFSRGEEMMMPWRCAEWWHVVKCILSIVSNQSYNQGEADENLCSAGYLCFCCFFDQP
ncbi:uncharacterized protein LOC141705089 [Apium graveolens]|uniref:uncharacterized protein LOC141705089 n=1 Tax=Apium graveolens TaxID=4045 RepID=UPI003D78FA62